MRKIKEFETKKHYFWIALTLSGKPVRDYSSILDTKSINYTKKDQENIKNIIAVSATSDKDLTALNYLKIELKNKKNYTDDIINKLTFRCIKEDQLNKLIEQKQLRLDTDENTANLASNIIHYLTQDDDYLLTQNIDSIDIYQKNYGNPIILCEVLFWNKEYTIFTTSTEYYYIGRTLEDFEKDFEDICREFENDAFWGKDDLSVF